MAHELGHLCTPSHLNETYYCTIEDLNNYQEKKPAEKEANEFAAELLMPRSWLTQAIKAQDGLRRFNITFSSSRIQSDTESAYV